MSILRRIAQLVRDPAPDFVFELSESGIAWARPSEPSVVHWQELPPDTIRISPMHDNVWNLEQLSAAVKKITGTPSNNKVRRAAVILPDYCARLGVLDFTELPKKVDEIRELIRFRAKRTLAFDVEEMDIGWEVQSGKNARIEVVVVAASPEILGRYEAPFRQSGLHPGFVTLSALAALRLATNENSSAAPYVVAKLTGHVLAVTVMAEGLVKVFRCVQLDAPTESEIADVLIPTFAYVEDQLSARPASLRWVGDNVGEAGLRFQEELEVPVIPVSSKLARLTPYNAGLLGYLEQLEVA